MFLTYDELDKLAKEKYSTLTEREIEKYLEDNKKRMKSMMICYAFLAVVGFAFSITNIEFFIMATFIFTIPIVACIGIIYFFNFVRPNKKRIIIAAIKREIAKENNIVNSVEPKRKSFQKDYYELVENTSYMIMALDKLNKKYAYVDMKSLFSVHDYVMVCNTIEEYDNFNFYNWLYENIKEKENFYHRIVGSYKDLICKYEEYEKSYESLRCYTRRENMHPDWDYEMYHRVEVELFEQKKLNPISTPEIILIVQYGNNIDEYSKKFSCSFYELAKYLNNMDELREKCDVKKENYKESNSQYENIFSTFKGKNIFIKSTENIKINNSTYVKETTTSGGPSVKKFTRTYYDEEGNLHKVVEHKDSNGKIIKTSHSVISGQRRIHKENDLDKREDQLNKKEARLKEQEEKIKNASNAAIRRKQKELEQREAELKRKEQEFIKATEGHIYSSANTSVGGEKDSWDKLKELKKLYDDGEISFEEYDKKRKEYLEE